MLPLTGWEMSVVALRRRMNELIALPDGPRGWPPRLLDFVSWGCNYVSHVDCSRSDLPVYFFDSDLAAADVPEPDCLLPEADSLAGWLTAWLDGVDLWETGPKGRQLV